MKRGSWIGVTVVVALVLFIPSFGRAQGINGWWEVQIPSLKIGYIVTADWTTLHAKGPNVSYVYIFDASEDSYRGKACYVEQVEGASVQDFSVYMRNSVAVLTELVEAPNLDEDGNLLKGSTMILEILGFKGNPYQLKGYYTKFDTLVDRKVEMGAVIARKRNPENIPAEVMAVCP